MRSERGFSLIELIVIIAIISLLLSIATLDFSSWQKKYNIESQTKAMLTDITEARLQAMHRKNSVTITLNTNLYIFRRFSSSGDAAGTIFMTKQLKYPVQRFTSGALTNFSNTVLTIDERGYLGSNDYLTIAVAPNQTGASLNCLSVHGSQTNIGKINGANCELN